MQQDLQSQNQQILNQNPEQLPDIANNNNIINTEEQEAEDYLKNIEQLANDQSFQEDQVKLQDHIDNIIKRLQDLQQTQSQNIKNSDLTDLQITINQQLNIAMQEQKEILESYENLLKQQQELQLQVQQNEDNQDLKQNLEKLQIQIQSVYQINLTRSQQVQQLLDLQQQFTQIATNYQLQQNQQQQENIQQSQNGQQQQTEQQIQQIKQAQQQVQQQQVIQQNQQQAQQQQQIQGQDQQQQLQENSPLETEKQLLRQYLLKFFQQDDLIQFEKDFLKLKDLLDNIVRNNQQKEFYDQIFFQKILDMNQLQSPQKSKRLIELYMVTLGDPFTIDIICDLPEKERLIIDIMNSFFNLMEKFSNTYLEWNLKILFNHINQKLADQEFFHQILHYLPKDNGKFTYNVQLNEEQNQLISKLHQISQINEVIKKNEAITILSLLLGKCENFEVQYYIFSNLLTQVFENLVSMPEKIHLQIKLNFYFSLLDIVERYVFPTEYQIIIETLNMHGTRNFTLKNEKQYLQNHPQVYYSVASILNKILLHPSQTLLQLKALQIIRRMYNYFPVLRQLIENPLILVLQNISLYSKELNQEKDASIFLYKLLQSDDTTPSFKKKLEENQYIQKLKANKYYSIKALSYPNDIDMIYKTNNLNLQVMFPFYKQIEAGSFFHHNCIITKPNSLLYWNFKTIDYDISFGLYKIDSLQPMNITDYQESTFGQNEATKCKTIIPLQRANSFQHPVTRFILIKLPGFYRIVFDNTYSYWRAKELYYSIHVLEP